MKRITNIIVFFLIISTLSARADDLWADVARHQLGQDTSQIEAAFKLVDQAFSQEAYEELETLLLQALQHPEATKDGKSLIARMLMQVGRERSVEALAPMLRQEPLSTYARLALERIGGPKASNAIRQALTSASDTAAKTGLIGSLGVLGDRVSVEIIASLVSEEELAVVALHALGQIGGPQATAALADMQVAEPLRMLHRLAWIEAASTLPPKHALPALRLLAEDEDVRISGRALAALAKTAPTEGADRLLAVLGQTDTAQANAALTILAENMGGPTFLTHVLASWDALPVAMQARVIIALGQRGDSAALPIILASMESEDHDLRGAAIDAASRFDSSEAAAALLASQDRRAADAIHRMVGDNMDAFLISLLDKPAQRARAASLVQRRGTYAAATPLLDILSTPEPEGRQEMWTALGNLSDETYAKRFVPLVFHTEGPEQRMALGALRNLLMRSPDRREVFLLIEPYFAQASEPTKAFILDLAAAAATPEALALVENALDEAALRSRALRALNAWRTTHTAAKLLKITASPEFSERERLTALRAALQSMSKPGMNRNRRVEHILAAAKYISRPEEKRMLLSYVESARDLRLVPIVEGWLDNEEVRQEAELAAWDLVWNLRNRADESLRELAAKMLHSPNEETVKRAQQVQDFWHQRK